MRVFLQKMIKISGIFILFYIVQAVIFSIIFSRFSTMTYMEILIHELALQKDYNIKLNMFVALINAVQNLVYAVAVAVFATYTYLCYMNKPAKILFPPKLVIRHKENKKLYFGVLIGNKNRYSLNDVRCSLTFIYQKDNGGMNSEYKLKDTHTSIINYYRFSYDIMDVPSEIMRAYIYKKTEAYQKNAILVTLSGTGYANNKFFEKKLYKLSDIIIDEHKPEPVEKIINPFTNKIIKENINWEKLYREEEVGETERKNIVRQIETMLENKKNSGKEN